MSALGPGANRYSLPPIFLITVFFIFWAPVYWLTIELPTGRLIGQAYENTTLYQRVFPSYEYGFGRLREGELPLWNPAQLSGTPFLANPSTAIFQPLNGVFLGLHTEKALAAHAFLALILMGAGTVLLLRGLSARWAPATLGGIVYACSGAVAAGISRPEVASCLAWAPFLFWALREYAREYRLSFAVLAGLFSACVWLGGAWGVALAIHVFALPYGLLRSALGHDTIGPGSGERLRGVVWFLVISGCVAMVQWAPTLVWALTLDRPLATLFGVDFAGEHAASYRELFAQVIGAPQGRVPHMAYAGVLAVAALPGAFFHPFGRFDAWLFAGMVVLGLSVPLFFGVGSGFAVAFLFPAALGLAILASLGVDRLLSTTRDPRSPLVWGPILMTMVLCALMFQVAGAETRGRVMVLLIMLLPVLILRIRWVSFGCALLLSLFVLADLTIANRNIYQHPFADAPAVFHVHDSELKAAEEQALGGRVILSAHPLNASLSQNLGMLTPLNVAGGAYLPLTREQRRWWARLSGGDEGSTTTFSLDAQAPNLINYMAARVIVAGQDSALRSGQWPFEQPRLRPARSGERLTLFANDDALRRVQWTPAWQQRPSFDTALDTLSEADFPGTQLALITTPGATPEALAEIPEAGAELGGDVWAEVYCAIAFEAPEEVRIEVSAPVAGIVSLADSDAPGWRAYLNGERVPHFRANGLFRAVPVPEGSHELVFRYQPMPVYFGLIGGLSALACLNLWGIYQLFRGRRS